MSDTACLTTLTKREFIDRWFQQVWTEEDACAIDAMMAPDAVVKGLGNFDSVGPADFRVFQQSLLSRIRDVRFTIVRALEEGDWIAALWTFTATDRATGQPVTSSGTVFAEIRDGQFRGGYNHFDAVAMYQGMGLLPGDTLPRLLSGHALA